MTFASLLRELMEESGGGLAALLMGRDGLAIEEVHAPALDDEQREQLGNAGIELGRLLEEARKASDSFVGGRVQELVVVLDHYWLVVRAADEDALLVLALAPGGNLGKARFLMRRRMPELRALL